MDYNNIIKLSLDKLEPLGTVVNYFTVPEYSDWGMRTLGDYELILIVSGSFEFKTLTANIKLGAGDVLTILPGEEHHFFRSSNSGENAVISCIHLSLGREPDALSQKFSFEIEPRQVASCYGDDEIHHLFAKANDIFTGSSRLRELLLSTILRELWLRLSEYWERGGRPPISPRTRQMVSYIEKNMLRAITRHDLATNFKLTPERVNALFKDELRTTPSLYINRLRVYHAYNLLSSRILSVKEVALQSGFNDEFYFSRVFKKIIGYPPSHIIRCREF